MLINNMRNTMNQNTDKRFMEQNLKALRKALGITLWMFVSVGVVLATQRIVTGFLYWKHGEEANDFLVVQSYLEWDYIMLLASAPTFCFCCCLGLIVYSEIRRFK